VRNKITSPLTATATTAAKVAKTLRPRKSRVSFYSQVVEVLRHKGLGEIIMVVRPRHISESDFKLLVESAIKNAGLRAPDGCFFSKRFDMGGNLVVSIKESPE
jgi:hypothetical protein